MVKKWKMKVEATKIQADGSDKKEIRKKRWPLNIIIVLLKWNRKCKLLLLKYSLIVKTKSNQGKVVVTKCAFVVTQNESWCYQNTAWRFRQKGN